MSLFATIATAAVLATTTNIMAINMATSTGTNITAIATPATSIPRSRGRSSKILLVRPTKTRHRSQNRGYSSPVPE